MPEPIIIPPEHLMAHPGHRNTLTAIDITLAQVPTSSDRYVTLTPEIVAAIEALRPYTIIGFKYDGTINLGVVLANPPVQPTP